MHVLHALKKINLTNYLYIYSKKICLILKGMELHSSFLVMVNIQLARPF